MTTARTRTTTITQQPTSLSDAFLAEGGGDDDDDDKDENNEEENNEGGNNNDDNVKNDNDGLVF